MSVHFITGKLGGGKSLVSVGRIKDYILAGKKVATNLDLYLDHLIPRDTKKCEVYRVPDKPTITDLEALGRGTYSKHEEDFGLLVLDELGTWLNSRTYQKDKERQDVINWFLHARHLGWDVVLIVQDIDLIDKQVRIALSEHLVVCRRTDRIPLPVIGFLFKIIFGYKLKCPRVHVGTVFYGVGQGAIKVDTWAYRGTSLFNGYDTSQLFQSNDNRIAQFIPPAYLDHRRFSKKDWRFYMRLTKVYFKRFKAPAAFVCGLLVNCFVLGLFIFYSNKADAVVEPAPDNISIELESAADETASPGGDTDKKFVSVPLPFSIIMEGSQYSVVLFLDGAIYTEKNIPVDIVWLNQKPFYMKEI